MMCIYVVSIYVSKYEIYTRVYYRRVQKKKKKTGRFRECHRLGSGESAAPRIHVYCNPRRKYPLAPFHPQIVKSLVPSPSPRSLY